MTIRPGAITEVFPVVDAFEENVIRAGVRPAQMVLVAFLITFGCVRAYTYASRRGRGPGNLRVGGLHVHHLVPGILLLLVSGFVAIAVDPEMPWFLWWLVPTTFGVGAALTLDEFALWVHLRDVYWAEEGRRSIDAVIVAAALGGIVALGAPFWGAVIREATPVGATAIMGYHALSVVTALGSLAKGKWVTGAAGLLLWPLGMVGSVRLARPGSLWARHLYGPEKLDRARARFPEDAAHDAHAPEGAAA